LILWKRKLYRIVMGGLAPGIYLLTADPLIPACICGFFLFWLLLMEFERYLHPGFWAWLLKHSPGIFKTRPGVLTGDTNFMIASFLSILYFPYPVAVSNLLFLAFGDAASALVGSKYGRLRIFPGKTVEGMMAGIGINLILAFILAGYFLISFEILLIGVLLGSILEVLPLNIDDNLTVGLIPGIVMTGFYL